MTDKKHLKNLIETAWSARDTSTAKAIAYDAVQETLAELDDGRLRVAEKYTQGWYVHEWIKKAILLSFRWTESTSISPGIGGGIWYDKVSSKFVDWDRTRFVQNNIRAVPGSIVRHSAYIGCGVVLMPCFVNVGAFIDQGTMIDTWATVGSCAQIGKNVHISGGTGIGGVLEPIQSYPVIIEDECFIGARSEVAEGVLVERGSVIAMGVFLGGSTKIVHRETGEVFYGRVPPFSVVVPGTLPGRPLKDGTPGPNLACAVIVKQVDERTRSRTAINEILRI